MFKFAFFITGLLLANAAFSADPYSEERSRVAAAYQVWYWNGSEVALDVSEELVSEKLHFSVERILEIYEDNLLFPGFDVQEVVKNTKSRCPGIMVTYDCLIEGIVQARNEGFGKPLVRSEPRNYCQEPRYKFASCENFYFPTGGYENLADETKSACRQARVRHTLRLMRGKPRNGLCLQRLPFSGISRKLFVPWEIHEFSDVRFEALRFFVRYNRLFERTGPLPGSERDFIGFFRDSLEEGSYLNDSTLSIADLLRIVGKYEDVH